MAYQRDFYRFNFDSSHEHFGDGMSILKETYFHAHPKGFFSLNTYSCMKEDYNISYEGIEVLDQSYGAEISEADPELGLDRDEMHHWEFDWKIVSDEGYVEVPLEGSVARIEWSGGVIKDLNGYDAVLTSDFRVEEDLTEEEEANFIEQNRLLKLQNMIDDDDLKLKLMLRVSSLNPTR